MSPNGIKEPIAALERWLRIDDEGALDVRARARAVYVVGLTVVVLQAVNVAVTVTRLQSWQFDGFISAGVSAMVIAGIVILRWYKNFDAYAFFFGALLLLAVIAVAVPDAAGIRSTLLPYICLGPVIIGFIGTWRASIFYAITAQAVLVGFFFLTISQPLSEVPIQSESDFERLLQATLVLILGTVVAVNFSINSYSSLAQLHAEVGRTRKAEAAKSQFLATMSHELRTPLNGVIGMAEVLSAAKLAPRERELAETIRRSGQSLLVIIGDLLDLSKIEAGKMTIEKRPFSLAALIQHSVGIWAGPAALKDLRLRTEMPDHMPDMVLGDEHRVGQILHNLFSNAIKFTECGEVALKVEIEGRTPPTFHFRVSDTGRGIPADAREQIFEAFEQGEQGTTRRYGGTGLGLPICRLLAQLMGGSISLERTGLDGSVFCLSLPLETVEGAGSAAEGARCESACDLSGLRILVAEDNEVNRLVMREFLRSWDVSYTFANDGPSALEALEADSFDVILLDKHMPGMSGPEVARAIRTSGKRYATVPIVAVTADTLAGEALRTLEAGMDAYVSKPVKPDHLKQVIASVLARRKERGASGCGQGVCPDRSLA